MARAAKPPKKTPKKASKPSARADGKKTRGRKPAAPKSAEKLKDIGPLKPSLWVRVRRKMIKIALIVVVIACLLPVLMTLLYIPSSVHPVSTLMVSHWVSGKKAKRQWVSLDKISPYVAQSVISSEDGRFCFHSGVDWDAVNLVVDDLLEGERPRGASTIAMQTVKNTFLWSDRSYIRKVLEVPLALLTDKIWGKRRMLEIYLNIAEWGPGIFGIEQAAQHHFGRSAAKLSRRQSALLAVTLPNPALRNPAKPRRGLRRLARLVEKRAKQSGAYIKCLK